MSPNYKFDFQEVSHVNMTLDFMCQMKDDRYNSGAVGPHAVHVGQNDIEIIGGTHLLWVMAIHPNRSTVGLPIGLLISCDFGFGCSSPSHLCISA